MRELFCPTDGARILSPGVGYFYMPSRRFPCLPARTVGCLLRLGDFFALSVLTDAEVRIEIPSGTSVDVGTCLGYLGASPRMPNDISNDDDHPEFHWILAPADGFMSFTDDDGTLFCLPGQIIAPGDRVASIEFMKLKIDIAYEGTQTAVFEHYSGNSPRAVRAGDVIAFCLLSNTAEHQR